MPFIQGKDVRLYYERTGQGPQLLFLNGSGVTIDDSRLLLSLFASHFDFVAYDYRGLGKSSEPPGPYGMTECAGDALSVLDAVGWKTACMLGISFGGMVTQELAVTAPGRVRRLALLCTSPGGKGGSSYPLDELESLPRDERVGVLRQLVDTRFDDQWLASHPQDHRLVELLAGRDAASDPGQQRGRAGQLAARRSHDVWDRLPSITCPAFIGCGRFDGIAPPRLSAAIAARIPGAELHTYEGGPPVHRPSPPLHDRCRQLLEPRWPNDGTLAPADRPPGAPEPSAQRSSRRPKRQPATRTRRRNDG